MKFTVNSYLDYFAEDLHVEETILNFNNKDKFPDATRENHINSTIKDASSKGRVKERPKISSSTWRHDFKDALKYSHQNVKTPQVNASPYHIKFVSAKTKLPIRNSVKYKTPLHKKNEVSLPHRNHILREKQHNFFNNVKQHEITDRTDDSSGIMILQLLLNLVQLIGIVFNSAIGRFLH